MSAADHARENATHPEGLDYEITNPVAAPRLGRVEFTAMIAMLMATVAFSIDAMLPALPEIGATLSPADPTRAQLVVTSFVLGMGLGTFFTGPLSDAFGRKPVVLGGVALYLLATLAAWSTTSLEGLLFTRVLMGIAAAGPRVVAVALVRDLYKGRVMAQMMSFIMVIFSLVPALAPSVGYYIIAGFGWRAVFLALMGFALFSGGWLLLRQPETLSPAARRPLKVATLAAAVREMFAHQTARTSILIQTLSLGMLFTVVSSVQMIFDVTFGRGDEFHLWFGGIALLAASASVLNARIVMRLGMRAIIRAAFRAQIVISGLLVAAVALQLPEPWLFPVFVFWTWSNFFQLGLTIGNLNALAMEEMGHIAGVAASVISAVSTVGAVFIAAPLGLMFDGTPLPMAAGIGLCAVLALWLSRYIHRPGDPA